MLRPGCGGNNCSEVQSTNCPGEPDLTLAALFRTASKLCAGAVCHLLVANSQDELRGHSYTVYRRFAGSRFARLCFNEFAVPELQR